MRPFREDVLRSFHADDLVRKATANPATVAGDPGGGANDAAVTAVGGESVRSPKSTILVHFRESGPNLLLVQR